MKVICMVFVLFASIIFIGADGDCDSVENRISNSTTKTETTVQEITAAGQYVDVLTYQDLPNWFKNHKADRKIISICGTGNGPTGIDTHFIIISEPYAIAEVTSL